MLCDNLEGWDKKGGRARKTFFLDRGKGPCLTSFNCEVINYSVNYFTG